MIGRNQLLVGLKLAAALVASQVEAAWTVSAPFTYHGMCDASAGAALGTNLFVAADDEGNELRIYHTELDGFPVSVLDVSAFLRLQGKHPETDLEGAAWLGERIFWIGSHGRNREGKERPNRQTFFATTPIITDGGMRLVPFGFSYKRLLKDLTTDPRLRPFRLDEASRRAPKAEGALNIEGLCAFGRDALLIGFRNPIPNGRALLVPLLNPHAVVLGERARLGAPIRLDLGGRGVRDLANWKDKILILAGSYDTERDFQLYEWSGAAEPPRAIEGIDFKGLNPEALVVYPEADGIQILSDDGTFKVQGIECKHLTDPAQKRFKAAWLRP